MSNNYISIIRWNKRAGTHETHGPFFNSLHSLPALTSRRELFCVDDFGGELEAGGLLHAPPHHREGTFPEFLLELVVVRELRRRVLGHLCEILSRPVRDREMILL